MKTKKLSKDEEADEIIKRLQAPPKTRYQYLEEELIQRMVAEMAKEIDNEIIKSLQIQQESEEWQKQYPSTKTY